MKRNTEFKVINAGNCMMCHKPIKYYVSARGSCEFPNVFFCKECTLKMNKEVHLDE